MTNTNSEIYKTFYEAESRIKKLEIVMDWLRAHSINNAVQGNFSRSIPQFYLDVLIPLVEKELQNI